MIECTTGCAWMILSDRVTEAGRSCISAVNVSVRLPPIDYAGFNRE